MFAVAWPIVLLLSLRWALIEPYVIPSGSMIPNLLIHDHVMVGKSSFGLRVPFSDQWLLRWSSPRRGDVIVFRFPENPTVFYVKRLIGLPGDRLRIQDGHIWVNDVEWTMVPLNRDSSQDVDFDYFTESSEGVPAHTVRFLAGRNPDSPPLESAREWTLSEGHYFFMGDNRDQSSDSRVWGVVPEKNLIGRAWLIWLSCDEMLESAKFVCDPATIRWSRLFRTTGLSQ